MIDFGRTLENLREIGFDLIPNTVQIRIPDAKNVLWRGIQYFTGDAAQWRPEYETVAQWLSDNKGKGLLCFGNCGCGKTFIYSKIMPLLFSHYHRKIIACYDAQQMNANIDMVKEKHIIYIDDVGTENMSIKYGERRMAFPELVDEAEKKGKLLLLSTNLSIQELREKYGERTVDRLRAITTAVLFKGESMRK